MGEGGGGVKLKRKYTVRHRVARSKKIKKAKFGHKQFKKRPNPEKGKKAK